MDIKSLFPYEELSQGPLTQAGESQGLCWRHGDMGTGREESDLAGPA